MYIVWRPPPPPPPPPPTPTKAIVSAFNSEDECWRRFHRDNNISDHRPRTSLSTYRIKRPRSDPPWALWGMSGAFCRRQLRSVTGLGYRVISQSPRYISSLDKSTAVSVFACVDWSGVHCISIALGHLQSRARSPMKVCPTKRAKERQSSITRSPEILFIDAAQI